MRIWWHNPTRGKFLTATGCATGCGSIFFDIIILDDTFSTSFIKFECTMCSLIEQLKQPSDEKNIYFN
jgi:hypothetical protein